MYPSEQIMDQRMHHEIYSFNEGDSVCTFDEDGYKSAYEEVKNNEYC